MPLRSASTRPLKMRLIHQNSDHINEILLAWHMNQTPGSQGERERGRGRYYKPFNAPQLEDWLEQKNASNGGGTDSQPNKELREALISNNCYNYDQKK